MRRKTEGGWKGYSDRHCTYYHKAVEGGGLSETFVALRVPRQCPLVLLVKVGWWQGKALGNEEC